MNMEPSQAKINSKEIPQWEQKETDSKLVSLLFLQHMSL